MNCQKYHQGIDRGIDGLSLRLRAAQYLRGFPAIIPESRNRRCEAVLRIDGNGVHQGLLLVEPTVLGVRLRQLNLDFVGYIRDSAGTRSDDITEGTVPFHVPGVQSKLKVNLEVHLRYSSIATRPIAPLNFV